MNLLALFIGLAVERLLTRLFHLREFRWLDPVFDAVFRRLGGVSPVTAGIPLALMALALLAPVAYLQIQLAQGWLLVAYFAFAVLVLLFSLGPRDLHQEVADYRAAVERGSAEDVDRIAKELAEQPSPGDSALQAAQIERAIYVQANNRVFAVVFWFFALGPAGAWLFRVLDLMRRRAVYRLTETPDHPVLLAARSLQGSLAWLPGRLMAGAFALAGSFQDAVTAWRQPAREHPGRFFQATNELIGRVGQGARGAVTAVPAAAGYRTEVTGAALGMVRRTLLIWCAVIAILTLNEWLH